MPTKEIPRAEWKEFLRDFSHFHQGWVVSIEVFDQAIGAQKEAGELIFGGVVVERGRGGKEVIEVLLGERAESHLRHTIAEPAHVQLDSEGERDILRIEGSGGTTLLISCRRSALPAKATYGTLQET